MPDRRKFESVMGTVIRRAEAAALVKYRRVAIFGEMVALLWAEKNFDAAIRLEQLWNELAKAHFFYLRCAYPVSGFQGELKRALLRGLRRALGSGARRGRCLISICGR